MNKNNIALVATMMLMSATQTVSANYEQAVIAFEKNDTNRAVELFEQNKQLIDAKIYLSKIYLETDLDDAEDWIEAAVEQDDDHAQAHFVRGIVMGRQASDSVFSALSYAKKSKYSFTRAVELEPNSVEYQMGLLQFNVSAPSIAGGDIEQAKAIADTVATLDPKAGFEANIEIAKSEEKFDRARELLNQAKAKYADIPDFYFIEGMLEQRLENYSRAIDLLSIASQKETDEKESSSLQYAAMYQLGRTCVIGETEFEKGIAALEAYIVEAPQDKELPSKDWAQFRLANLYEAQGQKSKASKIYQGLVKTEEKDLRKQVKKKI